MENASTERSFLSHPELETRMTDNQTVVLFIKESLDADKHILVGNITPLKFAGGPTKHQRRGKNQVYWDIYISVAVLMVICVPVEEDFWTL